MVLKISKKYVVKNYDLANIAKNYAIPRPKPIRFLKADRSEPQN